MGQHDDAVVPAFRTSPEPVCEQDSPAVKTDETSHAALP
jgi:hypothetical protein